MRLSPFPWAQIRWPKAPTGSVGAPKGSRVTSHTQTDRATVTGSNSISPEGHLMSVVLGVPFAILWLTMCASGAAEHPELWFTVLAALPFVVWRYRVLRRARRRLPRTRD